MIKIEPVLASLGKRRPIFHSEADFQHELAHASRAHDPELELRLEYPIGTDTRASLDILLRKGEARFELELKYLCRSCDVTRWRALRARASERTRHSPLRRRQGHRPHGAVRGAPQGRRRGTHPQQRSRLLSSRRRADTIDAAFDLADLRQLTGTLGWAANAGAGTMKGRADPLIVSGSYALRWCDYADVGGPGGRLRYLYAPVAASPPGSPTG